jgi:hypothetical protein
MGMTGHSQRQPGSRSPLMLKSATVHSSALFRSMKPGSRYRVFFHNRVSHIRAIPVLTQKDEPLPRIVSLTCDKTVC